MWGRAAEKPDFSGGSSFLRTEQESRSGAAGRVLSVSAFMRSVRDLLEHRIPPVWIGGEISNFTPARSGHWYFALKDGQAQVRCVMFRNRNQSLDWEPRDGAQVELRALATLYEPRGDFQLTVETLRPAGLGALYEQFLRLRDRLAAEGLFSEALKRPLPAHPRRVGIISSPDGAAVHDILSTLARRNPGIEAILYPSAVPGERAAGMTAFALLFGVDPYSVVLSNKAIEKSGIKPDMPIAEKLKRLKGLNIGITQPGGASDTFIRFMMKAHGLNADDVVTMQPTSSSTEMIGLLQRNMVDGISMSTPSDTMATSKGYGKVVISAFDGDVPELSGMPFAAMLAKIGILTTEDENAIASGLEGIAREIDAGTFAFDGS
jgi:hypothetical protein